MKKLIAVLMITMVILALVAGCSEPEPEAPLAVATPEAAASTTAPLATTTTTTTQAPPPLPSTTAPYTVEVSGTVKGAEQGKIYDSQEITGSKETIRGRGRIVYSGDLEGELSITFTIEIDLANMNFTREGEAAFSGNIKGKEGTFTARNYTTGHVTGPDAGTSIEEYTVISGTGGLRDLHGAFIAKVQFDEKYMSGTYTGTLGFGVEPPNKPSIPRVTTTTAPQADGTIERTQIVDNSPPVTENGKQTTDRTSTWAVHGKLEGTWVRAGKVVADMTTGKLTGNFDMSFTGTVDGKEGTFTTVEVGSGQAFSPTDGILTYESTVTGGTGELAGLTGTISIKATYNVTGSRGTYTCKLSFGEQPTTTPSTPAAGASYSWQEAYKHVGETATVSGPIHGFFPSTYEWEGDQLGMGELGAEIPTLNIILRLDVSTLPDDKYKGKTVSVTGEIAVDSRGGVQIIVTDLSQIKVYNRCSAQWL